MEPIFIAIALIYGTIFVFLLLLSFSLVWQLQISPTSPQPLAGHNRRFSLCFKHPNIWTISILCLSTFYLVSLDHISFMCVKPSEGWVNGSKHFFVSSIGGKFCTKEMGGIPYFAFFRLRIRRGPPSICEAPWLCSAEGARHTPGAEPFGAGQWEGRRERRGSRRSSWSWCGCPPFPLTTASLHFLLHLVAMRTGGPEGGEGHSFLL